MSPYQAAARRLPWHHSVPAAAAAARQHAGVAERKRSSGFLHSRKSATNDEVPASSDFEICSYCATARLLAVARLRLCETATAARLQLQDAVRRHNAECDAKAAHETNLPNDIGSPDLVCHIISVKSYLHLPGPYDG